MFPIPICYSPTVDFPCQSNARGFLYSENTSKPSHGSCQHNISHVCFNHQRATALTSFFIGLDWYVRRDGLGEKDIKQLFRCYLFHQPTGAFSAQSPYVNCIRL